MPNFCKLLAFDVEHILGLGVQRIVYFFGQIPGELDDGFLALRGYPRTNEGGYVVSMSPAFLVRRIAS